MIRRSLRITGVLGKKDPLYTQFVVPFFDIGTTLALTSLKIDFCGADFFTTHFSRVLWIRALWLPGTQRNKATQNLHNMPPDGKHRISWGT